MPPDDTHTDGGSRVPVAIAIRWRRDSEELERLRAAMASKAREIREADSLQGRHNLRSGIEDWLDAQRKRGPK